MRSTTLWARLLGVVNAVMEDVCFDDECIVVSVRPRKATKRRCGRCGKRCAGYDQGDGRRRWRALDLGTVKAFLEADSPRVRSPKTLRWALWHTPARRARRRVVRILDDSPGTRPDTTADLPANPIWRAPRPDQTAKALTVDRGCSHKTTRTASSHLMNHAGDTRTPPVPRRLRLDTCL